MGFGVSLVLIAVGAVLLWAVNASVRGVELDTIGVILMIVGGVGLLVSMLFWSSWGGWRPGRDTSDTTVVREDRVYVDRTF
jgi:hypothetical protein